MENRELENKHALYKKIRISRKRIKSLFQERIPVGGIRTMRRELIHKIACVARQREHFIIVAQFIPPIYPDTLAQRMKIALRACVIKDFAGVIKIILTEKGAFRSNRPFHDSLHLAARRQP